MSRQATSKKTQPEPLLAASWRYSYVSRPVLWAISVWGVAVAVWALDVRPLWVGVAAAAVALLSPAVATSIDAPLRTRWFAFVLMSAIGVYVTWCVLGTPFSKPAGIALAPGAFVFGAWWHILQQLAAAERARGTDTHAAAEKEANGGEYVALIERVMKKKPGTTGIKEVSRKPFKAGIEYGETIELQLPADGSVTYSRLDGLLEQLITAADATDTGLIFEKGETGRRVKLHVSYKDALIETRPLPFDRGPKSIHNPMDLGQYADGGVCVVTFREVAAMLVGLKGSGKSSLINTHLAYLTGCVDAKVWMIDLKGGETALPWIEPFLQATTGRPALDWLAVDAAEADLVLIAAKAAVQARAGKKVDPSREKPAIILVVEEASLVTGVGKYENTRRAGLLQDAVTTGRSLAVDALICSQRATVTMLGNGDMTSNLDLRYGMGVTDRTEAGYIFPDGDWAAMLTAIPKDRAHRGTFLVQDVETPRKMPAKSYWVDPKLIPGMAITNAEHQPDLDAETVAGVDAALRQAGAPSGYAGRWDRLRRALGYPSQAPVSQGASQPSRETPAQASQAPAQAAGETGGMSQGERLVQEQIAASRAERETARFDEIMAGAWDAETGSWRETDDADVPPEERDDLDVIPPILRHLVRIFGETDQLPTAFILESLPGGSDETTRMSPKAFSLLMGHCGIAPIENVKNAAGARVRGYERAAVYRALDRARRGQMPEAAFGWEP